MKAMTTVDVHDEQSTKLLRFPTPVRLDQKTAELIADRFTDAASKELESSLEQIASDLVARSVSKSGRRRVSPRDVEVSAKQIRFARWHSLGATIGGVLFGAGLSGLVSSLVLDAPTKSFLLSSALSAVGALLVGFEISRTNLVWHSTPQSSGEEPREPVRPEGPLAMRGFAKTFRPTRSTADWMKELREGEN